ncbi:MAG: TonB-dependent receptor [Shewanella sp.]|nr:TonB-dependent receptor [Shewanella sp.]
MRGDIDLLDTPQSVNVIPDFVTDEQLATNLGEVLSNDSSVTAGSEKWSRQVFSIRGFELDSGSGFLVNGHQHWSHYVQPIETLEQVEVLKGPSSMLYGQSGPGGLINIVTKKPTYDSLFTLGFDTDEKGSTRFQMDAGGAVNEEGTVRYRSVLVKQDTTYWTEYQNGENKERDRLLTFLALDFDLTDDITLSVKYDNTADKAGLDSGAWLYSTGDKIGQVIGEEDKIWELPWAFIDINVQNIGAGVQWHINDNWKMKTGYNHQMYERQRFGSSPTYNENPFEDGYTVRPFDRHDDWQYKTAYMDFISNFSTGSFEHQFLIGANMLDYFYQQQAEYGDKATVMPGQIVAPDVNYHNATPKDPSEYKHYGFYVQDLVTLTENWKALAGVRYDEQKKDGAGNNAYALSPKFGVIYEPTDYGSIYVNYSKSFMPKGSVNDIEDANNGVNLKPEYGTQYEIGTKWELFDGGLLMTAAVFDITVENRVVTQDLTTPVGEVDKITTQDGEQHRKGFEMGAQGQLTDSVFITGSMMYLDAKYKNAPVLDGKTPVDAPEWSANIWTRYEVSDALALNFGALYVGDRFANQDNTIVKEGYVRFDLGAAYTWDISGTEVGVRMNVQNLFDKEYLGGGMDKDVAIGKGRNISLAMEAKF